MRRRLALGTGVLVGGVLGLGATGKLWQVVDPVASAVLSGEDLHRLAVRVLALPPSLRTALGLVSPAPGSSLSTTVFGVHFPSVLGMAAGFDKHAECMAGVHDLGLGSVEVGSVTPLAQEGNPRPRVWKFKDQGVVVNCYGFNSHGHDTVQTRLYEYWPTRGPGVVGVNLGKNKTSDDALMDYRAGILRFHEVADYFVINVSSPNTPGLRDLQTREHLHRLLSQLKRTRDSCCSVPLLVKISPDVSDATLASIAETVLNVGVDGVVVSNTTTQWPEEFRALPGLSGGLSGEPLFEHSTRVLSTMYTLLQGKVPLIGVGGVSSAGHAYAKIKAGASLVQLYSAVAVQGPQLIPQINAELEALLRADGYTSVSQAVGADHRK